MAHACLLSFFPSCMVQLFVLQDVAVCLVTKLIVFKKEKVNK